MKGKTLITTGVNKLESLVPSFRPLGLSLNDSKAYTHLLEKSRITAYVMSKSADVPPSKTYGSLTEIIYRGLFVVSRIMPQTKLEALN